MTEIFSKQKIFFKKTNIFAFFVIHIQVTHFYVLRSRLATRAFRQKKNVSSAYRIDEATAKKLGNTESHPPQNSIWAWNYS